MATASAAVVLIALLFAAVGATAAAAEVRYHKSYEAALAAAKKHGQLILIVVEAPIKNQQGVEVCKMFRERVLSRGPVAQLINRCFAPMIFDIPKHRAGKQPIPPGLKLQGQITLPLLVFLDTNGKEVGRHVANPAGLLPKLQKVTEGLEGAKPAEESSLADVDPAAAVKQAEEAVEGKDYGAAMAALRPLLDSEEGGAEIDRAREMASDIEEKAKTVLDEGERLEAVPKLGSAIHAYRRCVRDFHGTASATRAAERLKDLRSDTELRARLNAYMARKLLARAEADVARRRYASATDAIEAILTRYAQSPQAAKAKALRQKLQADPAVAARINEDRVRVAAERLLSLARSFRLSKMPHKAIAQYSKVIQKYPGTRFARSAERHLKEIENE